LSSSQNIFSQSPNPSVPPLSSESQPPISSRIKKEEIRTQSEAEDDKEKKAQLAREASRKYRIKRKRYIQELEERVTLLTSEIKELREKYELQTKASHDQLVRNLPSWTITKSIFEKRKEHCCLINNLEELFLRHERLKFNAEESPSSELNGRLATTV